MTITSLLILLGIAALLTTAFLIFSKSQKSQKVPVQREEPSFTSTPVVEVDQEEIPTPSVETEVPPPAPKPKKKKNYYRKPQTKKSPSGEGNSKKSEGQKKTAKSTNKKSEK